MKLVVKEEPVATADSASDAILVSIMCWVGSGFETVKL